MILAPHGIGLGPRWRFGLILLAAALVARASWQQEGQAGRSGVELIVLPEGPLQELLKAPFSALESGLAQLESWPSWQDRGPAGWGSEQPWKRWVHLLQQASSGATSAAQRAPLALLARQQERDAAAWAHLLACQDARLMHALLPAFLPGRPLAPGAEFDGHFNPALPPASNPLDYWPGAEIGNSMEQRAVRFGESVFAMRVLLEGDGIQVDLTHVSGPTIEIQVWPPEPPGLRIALLYADWVKLGSERQSVPVRLAPGDPTFTIWGRFLALDSEAPIPRAGRLPEARPGSVRPELHLAVPASMLEDAFYLQLARSMAELSQTEVRLVPAGIRPGPSFPDPIVIQLGSEVDVEKRLLDLIDRLEESVLSQRDRPKSQLK